MKIMAQGDPIEYDVADPADACRLYRQDMTAALIGVVTSVTDYERAKRNAESVRLMNEERKRLEAENARFLAELDRERARIPGKYAFLHRHYAMSFVRQRDPDIHAWAASEAGQKLDREGALSYQDYVAQLERERDALRRVCQRMLDLDDGCDYVDGTPAVCPGPDGPCQWCDMRAALKAMEE